jgi:hypothetical protein
MTILRFINQKCVERWSVTNSLSSHATRRIPCEPVRPWYHSIVPFEVPAWNVLSRFCVTLALCLLNDSSPKHFFFPPAAARQCGPGRNSLSYPVLRSFGRSVNIRSL